jgi:hypothetical protein
MLDNTYVRTYIKYLLSYVREACISITWRRLVDRERHQLYRSSGQGTMPQTCHKLLLSARKTW